MKMRHGFLVTALGVTLVFLLGALNSAFGATETFATFKGCVYNKRTGKPVVGALVFVQALDSANGGGSLTGYDGCTQGMKFSTALFRGDYVQASLEFRDRKYIAQYHIPNGLIEQTYSYDFFLDLPRSYDQRSGDQ